MLFSYQKSCCMLFSYQEVIACSSPHHSSLSTSVSISTTQVALGIDTKMFSAPSFAISNISSYNM